MTKADVINEIVHKTGIDKADVDATIEAFVVIVKNSVADGQTINIRGFGSFGTKKRARKVARNISKNTALIVEEHYIPIFKPSKFFVEKIKKSNKLG
ncbi:MAG: DNA-binding protein HU-beta [Parvicella sp.]